MEGSFKETIEGIENLKQMDFNFEVHTVAVKQNYRYLFKIFNFCERNNINLRSYNFAEPSLKESGAYAEFACKMEDVLKSIKKEKGNYPENYFGKISASVIKYIPICLIREHFPGIQPSWNFKQQHECNFRKKYHFKEKRKCKFSNQCKLSVFCPGLFEQYLEIFGYNEFKPINGGDYE